MQKFGKLGAVLVLGLGLGLAQAQAQTVVLPCSETGANANGVQGCASDSLSYPHPSLPTAGIGGGGGEFFSSSLSNSAVGVKSSPGTLYGLSIYNPNASVIYVQVFNSANSNVVVGTTAPVLSFAIPATSVFNTPDNPVGFGFGTGISLAATTSATGSTAPDSVLVVNGVYK